MKSLQNIKFYTVSAILLLMLNSCGSSNENGSEPIADSTEVHEDELNQVSFTAAQYQTTGVELGTVELKQISGTFKVNGVLDVPPQQQVSISVPMGGFLRKTDLLQGMRVKKGQLIAVIENPDFVQMQQDYLESKSQLEYSQADYQRQQVLSAENVNSRKVLEQAKSSAQTLSARVKGLKERIKSSGINISAVEKGNIQSYINIYSPIDGFVTEVNANVGKFVNATEVLFEIVDTGHLHAELTVFEKDIPKLKIGQKVRFTLANETKERIAKVYLIGKKVSEERSVRIHCHIEQEDIHMLPGMYLKAIVESGQTQVPALPDQAIVDYQGEKFIFIQKDTDTPAAGLAANEVKDENKENHENEEAYQFEMIAIQIGNSDGGFTEVILPENKIASNARIVIKGAYDLLSKMKNSEEGGHGH